MSDLSSFSRLTNDRLNLLVEEVNRTRLSHVNEVSLFTEAIHEELKFAFGIFHKIVQMNHGTNLLVAILEAYLAALETLVPVTCLLILYRQKQLKQYLRKLIKP